MPKSKHSKTKLIKKELIAKEEKIVELAKIAWSKALAEFFFPPLNEPNYVFDYTHLEGFYIDPEHKWQITMNLANTPLFKDDQEYIDYFYIICLHEVSHYQIIPYDGLIHAKLLRAAMSHVNQNFAPIIVNIFADLIIDTNLYKKYPSLIMWELKVTYEHIISRESMSNFTKFLFRAYERMWDVEILKDDTLKEMDSLAEKVIKVILKNPEDESTWEKKVSTIAKYLNALIQDTFTLIGTGGMRDKAKEKRKSPGGAFIEIPKDVLEVMDNPLDNKNSDKLKEGNEDELRQKAEEFAKEIPYSEFGGPARQAGILVDASPLATWYRGLAKNLIEIKIFEERPGGQLPIYPEVWRFGDKIEELDIVQTLLTSPVIIPNITTRKWSFREGPGHLVEKQIPDLLIVLDSSGSMGWKYTSRSVRGRGPYHIALVASFASLHYAANKGAKFSVINFSNKADICNWTSNFQNAENTLLRYQGGGTVLPLKEIVNQCKKAEKSVLIFLITDFGIYNWSKAKKIMVNLTENHKIVGFFIGSTKIPENKFKDLLDKVTFYGIRDIKDLIDLVIKEVKRYYS
ncbi:MAG: hypothetical protein ACFFA6_09695 [Promethearchaeota archaeon]